MKYLIVSDIHGSLPRLEQVLDFYENQQYDMLIILGDIVNYGPRNGVPEGLDAMGIVDLYNDNNGVLICNTGSITFPKGGNVPTFVTIDEDITVRLRQLDGSILKECKL